VLRDARLNRSRSWLSAKDSIAVTGDLRHLTTGVKSDAALTQNLAAAGVDVNALDAQLRFASSEGLLVDARRARARRPDADRRATRR